MVSLATYLPFSFPCTSLNVYPYISFLLVVYSDPLSPVLDSEGANTVVLSSSKYLATTVPLNTSVSVLSSSSLWLFPYSNVDLTLLVILSLSTFLNISDKLKLASTLLFSSVISNSLTQVNVLFVLSFVSYFFHITYPPYLIYLNNHILLQMAYYYNR